LREREIGDVGYPWIIRGNWCCCSKHCRGKRPSV
jgi:hypothetical protein